jgi:hypothetical protein
MRKLFDSLNGWQRVGVVLSVLWFFIAGISQRSYDVNKAYEFAHGSSSICYESHKDGNSDNCRQRFSEDYRLMLDGSWGNVIFMAIVPIPIFWGIVILIIKVYRWIKKGFAK